MQTFVFTEADLEQIKQRGISRASVEKQLKRFESGFPFLKVERTADLDYGIHRFTPDELNLYLAEWSKLLADPKSVIVKFVPASGAASRMFKDLFQYADAPDAEMSNSVAEVLEHLSDFAFHDALNRVCLVNSWRTVSKMHQQGEYKEIISNIIESKGLNYGHLPKALILFHNYDNDPRTPVEEHLAEGAMYAKNSSGKVRLHFTLSPEHIDPFKSLLLKKIQKYEDDFSVQYEVTHSVQLPETDTIAVTMDNEPFREADGKLLFRPGGHGALIRNLSEVDADVIFIKNIDNVVPDRYKCDTIIYKKALGGYLIQLRNQVYRYMHQLNDDKKSSEKIEEIRAFLAKSFCVDTAAISDLTLDEQAQILFKLLNRPIRVCGMVRNESEPGGGPYVVRDSRGITSLQILESTQINMEDEAMRSMFANSAYFNPVDLVCCTRDWKGQKFNLDAFVDEETGFISSKSKDGRDLKALELPGLWNGGMADWLTSFVEVPATTFNPVKTINDLLRPAHQ